MSHMKLSTQVVARCANTWLRASPVMSAANICTVPIGHHVRHVSTTKPKKAQAMKEALKEPETMPAGKAPKASTTAKTKKTSTKAAAATAPKEVKPTKETKPTKARVTKTKAASSEEMESKPKTTSKKTASVRESLPSAQEVAQAAKAPKVSHAGTSTAPPSSKIEEPKSATVSASAKTPPTAAAPLRSAPSQQKTVPPLPPQAAKATPPPNPSSTSLPSSRPKATVESSSAKGEPNSSSSEYKKKYNEAAWRWTSTMIALPILLVTSYFLFDRLALGNEPGLEAIRQKIQAASGKTETPVSGENAQNSNKSA